MKIDKDVLEKLRRLETSECKEWISLVKDIGEDPKTFFDNGVWVGVNFSMSDMSQADFRGSLVEGCIFATENESKNYIHLTDKRSHRMESSAVDVKAGNEAGEASPAIIRQVNQLISDAKTFKEALKILQSVFRLGGPINVDTVNRLWHKVDDLEQLNTLIAVMNQRGIKGNEDSVIAIAKAKSRIAGRKKLLSNIPKSSVKIDKRRMKRAHKVLSVMLRKRRD